MEAFSLLKYWKGGGSTVLVPVTTSTITAVSHQAEDSDFDAGDDDNHDDGPFFDLDINYCHRSDPNPCLSPSDDELLIKGQIIKINGSDEDINSNGGQFWVPVALVRSTAKLRVFMLGFKWLSKSEATTKLPQPSKLQNQIEAENQPLKQPNKLLLMVKFKLEEVPIVSLFITSSQKSSTKDVKQKYLNRVSKRQNNEKNQATTSFRSPARCRGAVAAEEASMSPAEKGQNWKGMSLKVMAKKHSKKSKSAVHSVENSASRRRDYESTMEEDGIQSAILHCKRSFHCCRDANDPSHQKKTTITATEWSSVVEENDVVSVNGGRGGDVQCLWYVD